MPAAVRALKSVLLPTFGSPTMPILNMQESSRGSANYELVVFAGLEAEQRILEAPLPDRAEDDVGPRLEIQRQVRLVEGHVAGNAGHDVGGGAAPVAVHPGDVPAHVARLPAADDDQVVRRGRGVVLEREDVVPVYDQ